VEEGDGVRRSDWLGAGQIFTTPEFQRRYDRVDISLLTPKCALVPLAFFSPGRARQLLEDTVSILPSDHVEYVELPELASVLVYSNSIGESLSRVLSQTVLTASGDPVRVYPEMYFILRTLPRCEDYNRIVASYRDGWLHLAVAQGKSLLLANVFQAPDFTTAEYFLFLALKRLQLNPEVSTVHFRTPIDADAEMSLYRYFKSVVLL